MDIILPNYLYKYLPLRTEFSEEINDNGSIRKKNGFDALKDMLINNRIYYSKPRYFNDPFEFDGIYLSIQEANKEKIIREIMIPLLKNDLIQEKQEQLVAQVKKYLCDYEEKDHKNFYSLVHRCGYICLCEKKDETLMWSHYADAHRGICLRLKCQQDAFYEDDGAGRVVKVYYDDKIEKRDDSLGTIQAKDAIFLKMSKKAKCWRYEHEYRIFRIPTDKDSNDAYGNHPFNSSLIDAVYIGLKTPDDDISIIQNIISSARHKIKLYKAKKNRAKLKIFF